MLIGDDNYLLGNKAMAWVLLLYYHLITEGRITKDQNVYVDPEDFDAFSFLGVDVQESHSNEINQSLLREGAEVYLLCELNDCLDEFDEKFLSHPKIKEIVSAFEGCHELEISEINSLVRLLSVPETEFDWEAYLSSIANIREKYVVGRFKRLVT